MATSMNTNVRQLLEKMLVKWKSTYNERYTSTDNTLDEVDSMANNKKKATIKLSAIKLSMDDACVSILSALSFMIIFIIV